MTKHIFVTGGVVSSLGKGLTSAAIGMLLERRGLRVRMQKMDPYINVDPGTMSPYQHGEVYVLDDGAETDLDLGHYERFTHAPLNKDCNYTTGKIYLSVIEKERRGDYKGKTVQVIPHITDEIKSCIRKLAGPDVDVVITEIGGTVGDIEGMPFFEAIRQFALEVGKQNCLFIHLTLVPYLKAAGELKTKPTQHSVRELRAIGIQPDLLICRTEREIPESECEKIALFCNIERRAVIEEKDKEYSVYEVPLSATAISCSSTRWPPSIPGSTSASALTPTPAWSVPYRGRISGWPPIGSVKLSPSILCRMVNRTSPPRLHPQPTKRAAHYQLTSSYGTTIPSSPIGKKPSSSCALAGATTAVPPLWNRWADRWDCPRNGSARSKRSRSINSGQP
ncbi:MAG: hypothetical protein KatS3mg106_656 [Gemmataceae bacterium]|nr:MAG: hypothetical protein KatS3mg106_656 [Gemmataceae bacterium]